MGTIDNAARSRAPSRGKVLVVDDDQVALKVTRARLEGAGFEVITRSEAIGTSLVVSKEKPNLILLDFRMPGMTGDVLAKVLGESSLTKATPVIFHSGENLDFLQARAKEVGVAGAIAKTDSDKIFLAQFERLFSRISQ